MQACHQCRTQCQCCQYTSEAVTVVGNCEATAGTSYCTSSDDLQYRSFQGTTMATPVGTGAAVTTLVEVVGQEKARWS